MPRKPNSDNDTVEVYEEWVSHPDKRQYVPRSAREKMRNAKGWFSTGWRGLGPDMQPLPLTLAKQLDEQDNADVVLEGKA